MSQGHFKRFIHEKNTVLPTEKVPSLVLHWDVIMLQHFIIHCVIYYLSSVRLREVKNKREFQTFSPKTGRGRFQEVPNIVI